MRAIYRFLGLTAAIGLAIALTMARGVSALAQDAVPLIGNHPASAETEAPVGARAADMQLTMAVTLQLRDPAGAAQLAEQLQDPSSPNYHQWLSPADFTARFGPTQGNLDAVTQWLTDAGFTILSADAGQRVIRFTGTVAQAQQAFRTMIFDFGNTGIFGNVADPVIPARFANVIAQIHGLDNMRAAQASSHFIPRLARSATGATRVPHPARAARWPKLYAALTRDGQASDASPATVSPDAIIGGLQSFGPADFQTFYDATPLASAGINGGGGDCIAIVGDSDFAQSAVDSFNTNFSQAASNITTVVVNGLDPGFNNDEEEALLDLEWSHAVAPGAPTRYYVGNSSAAVIAPIVDQINAAVTDNQCGVINVSFSLCGNTKTFFTKTVSPIYLQAAVQGQSIFVSSGDQGSAGLVFNSKLGCVTGTGRHVSQLAADPNITSVGGVSFNPTYDGSGNDTSVVTSTALRVWDDPNDGIKSGGATGGGASAYYAKPSYQYGLGVPLDNKRDIPDVSLSASPNFPGVFTYIDGDCFSSGCDGLGAPIAVIFGGTSLAAPSWAGIAKLVEQQNRVTRLGNLNHRIYQLANSTSVASIFQDVTAGNNKFNGAAGYNAGPGFDLATGWGTVDIDALANFYFAVVTPLGPPVLTFTPKTVAFGNLDFAVAGSASKVMKLTITNPTKYHATTLIYSITGTPGFTADPACNNISIAPGGKLVCNITYMPTALGKVSGALTVSDNIAGSPQTVALTGSGIQGALIRSPGTLNFGQVTVGALSAVKTVKLTNHTASTFTISSITNTNPAFVASQNCIGTLGTTSCSVSVSYTPSVTGKVTDTLTISDAPDGITKTVNLIGTGK